MIHPLPEEIETGLWLIGNSYFNLYLVRGDEKTALIELGVSGMIRDAVEQLGHLAIRPDFLIMTHPHGDHITGLPHLREAFPKATLIMAPGADAFLQHPKAAESIINGDGFISRFLQTKGFAVRQSPITQPIIAGEHLVASEDKELNIGNRTLQFCLVYGHSPGSLTVRIPDISAHIVSDSLGFRFSSGEFFPLYFTSFAKYLQDIENISQNSPKLLGIAHQGPIIGARQCEDALRDASDAAKNLLRRIVSDVRPKNDVISSVFRSFYRDECRMYTEENILQCAQLLYKRSLDEKNPT